MSNERVIAASFHNYRTVLGRKMLQLVFEVPLEQQGETLALLGYPNAEAPGWYAIARLVEKPAAPPVEREPLPAPAGSGLPEETEEGRRLVKQCAIHCADKRFQTYLANTGWISTQNEDDAAVVVRKICGIQSRKELATNEIAQVKWKSLHAQFRNSLADKDYGTGGYMR